MHTRYSHAAPFIRQAILQSADLKLAARTQLKQREYSGQMFGLVRALEILLNAPEGASSPAGYPEFNGTPAALKEVERFLGGRHRLIDFGFIK